MSIGLGEDLSALADVARRWCDQEVGDAGRRAGLDDQAPVDPDLLTAMAELGWTGLHLPADVGGQDAGLQTLAVVIEELGRGAVPGPFVPTVLASAVIDRLGSPDQRSALLPRLVSGTAATVAFASAPLPGAVVGEAIVLGGSLPVVVGAADAEIIVVPVVIAEAIEWAVVEAPDITVTTSRSIDLTRPVAEVHLDAVTVAADRRLLGPPDVVQDLAALLFSIEAIGLAQWCVDTTAAYARDRVQFGRPIGQFQAVKHGCADMAARVELARAALWDACRGGERDEERLAIAGATALAPDAAVATAKDCIQLHGGIGFTWEHDAHLYLRRALATQAMLPSAAAARAVAIELVRAGVERTLPVELPERAETVRAEVAAWLTELQDSPRDEWNARIAADGYLAPHWPRPWGRDADAVEQLVIDQEFREAKVRRSHLQVGAWALPTLIAHGSHEQQQRWMGPSMRFEVSWCQLFSEPEAGSDLAALRMKAERGDGGWLLTGQKVWTSMADTADWGICLARTSPDTPKHEGITCFFVDMASPGIEIRPLQELTGAAWFSEVFFERVFVPDDCVIGAVDDGWRAGRTTLANERVSMGSGSSIGAGVSALVALLDDSADPASIDAVGERIAVDHALSALRMRMTLRSLDGTDAGPEASIVKLLGVIHDQDVQEVGLRLLGPTAATADGVAHQWVESFLWNRCLTIAGGTSEVQRNVIGERLLGLPRDP